MDEGQPSPSLGRSPPASAGDPTATGDSLPTLAPDSTIVSSALLATTRALEEGIRKAYGVPGAP